jgi:hypothetical protein
MEMQPSVLPNDVARFQLDYRARGIGNVMGQKVLPSEMRDIMEREGRGA